MLPGIWSCYTWLKLDWRVINQNLEMTHFILTHIKIIPELIYIGYPKLYHEFEKCWDFTKDICRPQTTIDTWHERRLGKRRWKLNHDLLFQKDITEKCKKDSAEFFKLKSTADASIPIIWDASICMRRNLIMITYKKKKEKMELQK